jgi:hypothetical protein
MHMPDSSDRMQKTYEPPGIDIATMSQKKPIAGGTNRELPKLNPRSQPILAHIERGVARCSSFPELPDA